MLLIDIHKLDIILAQPIRLAALVDQVDHIGRILGLEGEDVLVLRGAEHLGERGQVDAQGDVAVAAKWGEGFGFQHHGDESNVRIVHGLQGDSGVVAVEVAVLDEVFDCVYHLWDGVSMVREVMIGRLGRDGFVPSSGDWPVPIVLPTLRILSARPVGTHES